MTSWRNGFHALVATGLTVALAPAAARAFPVTVQSCGHPLTFDAAPSAR